MYRSPSTCLETFLESLNWTIDHLNREGLNEHIIMGDMNIDLRSKNSIAEDYMNVMIILAVEEEHQHGEKRVQQAAKIDYEKIKRVSAQEDWSSLRNCDGRNSDRASELDLVNQLACELVDKIRKVTENSKIVIDKCEKRRKGWITEGIITSIKRRDEMYTEGKSKND
ncbi:hypothetical protein QAD02_012568 [Eretmocerus hayati]|uniref:Uncharacterized protein n=1 Tax=Eretmocerus hayati TaxID=131215 RepID=A0ACC2P1T1_9HYME|nr:hypothetical protein QAD02_012568 [Eretmocerus hayati]